METLSIGDRVRIIGPNGSVWLEDEGTVAEIEQGDPEEAVAVQVDDDGRLFFKPEHLEKID
jgi:hypothetical protein